MTASEDAFLDALASCLGAGVSLPDALARIETAGAGASRWARRVRSIRGKDATGGLSVEDALLSSQTISGAEHALLASAATADEVEGILHVLALRRRRRDALGRAILRGLIGPFAIAALTVVLDPLPNLIGDGSYVGPVSRGLLGLGLVAAFIVVGVPAALRSPTLGPRLLAWFARVPGLAWLAARHAEAELVTISAPYAARSQAGSAGLLAASAMLAWSPLGKRIRGAALGGSTATPPPLDFTLVRLAPHLSVATNLSVVEGIASGCLPARLAARGEAIASALTTHARLGVRVVAYALVVLLSLQSLVSMFSRALPGGALLPGGAPNAEQKELEEIMKELGGPSAPPRQK